MKILSKIAVISLILGLVLPAQVFAQASNINYQIDRAYRVLDESSVRVVEKRIVTNNTANSVINKSGNFEVFSIIPLYSSDENEKELDEMAKSIKVKDGEGWNLTFNTEKRDGVLLVNVPYTKEVLPGSSIEFNFEYVNTQLVQKNGALVDIYVLGFSSDFQFSKNGINYNYNTKLVVPKNLGEENFISPSPVNSNQTENEYIYEFSKEQLLGHFIWTQRGTTQFYKFQISQEINKTEDFNTGNLNEYRMVIPKSLDGLVTTQEIYIENIFPKPASVYKDSDGNLIGVFKLASNIDTQIYIRGYAKVKTNKDVEIQNLGNISDLDNILGVEYYSAAQYWEVEDEAIKNKSISLKEDKTDLYDIIKHSYDYVVESIDYSDIKRFGINERQGALKTLQGGAAVCMEYSDLYLTLLRAQGVPTRAAFGYGYDPKNPSNGQELHQWIQVYSPLQKKWINIDVTWGENGPALIGGDLNHFMTHTAAIDPNTPATLSGITYGDFNSFGEYSFDITIVESAPESFRENSSQLLELYPHEESNNDVNVVVNDFSNRYRSGLLSIIDEGINTNNPSQILFLATNIILFILLTSTITFLIKFTSEKGTRGSKSKKEEVRGNYKVI